MLKQELLKNALLAGFTESEILSIASPRGDDKHFEIKIQSSKFNQLSLLAQNRLVYSYISDLINSGEVHAVSLNLLAND
jgi:stress-induced morphogen